MSDDDFYYGGGDFSRYHPHSVDPSPWALLLTLSFCILLVLLLPLALALQQYSYKQKTKASGNHQETEPSILRQESKTTELTSFPIPRSTKSPRDDYLAMDNPFCYVEEDSTFNRLFDGQEQEEDDDSLYGLGTETSRSDLWEDDPLPKQSKNGGFPRAKGLASLFKRAFGRPSSSQPNKEKANSTPEDTESQSNYISMAEDSTVEVKNKATPLPVSVNNEEEEDDDEDDNPLCYSSSDSDEDRGHIFKLLKDDFDQYNGIEESTPSAPTKQGAPGKTAYSPSLLDQAEVNLGRSTSAHLSASKYDIDLCCGKRPWFGYFVSRGFFRKIRKCASFDDEMKKIAGLVIPYTLHAAVTHVFGFMEIVVIGQLIAGNNAKLLGAYLTVDFVVHLMTMFLDGAINSLSVLCGKAVSARNFELAGKYVHLAILLHQIVFLPIVVVCWNRIGNIVAWLGFDKDATSEAEDYGRFAFLAVAVGAYNAALHLMLVVTGFEWYSSVMDMIHSFASLAGVFAVGWLVADTPLWTVGAVHVAVTVIIGVLNVAIVVWNQWLMGFWKGLQSFALRDGRALETFITTVPPLSLGYVVEYCEWKILFVFAAAQGPAELAVWGLLGYVWEFSEHIGEAIADAAEVRVAHLLASQQPALARYSSHKSLLLGVTTSFSMSMLILGVRNHLPTWLTIDTTLQAMLSDLIPLVSVGLAALTFGSMSWTVLCAQGRVRLATAFTFLGTVCVTLPLAVLTTVILNWNLQGLLASLVVGHAISGIANSFIMVTSKWEKISDSVSKKSTKKFETKKKSDKTKKAMATEMKGSVKKPSKAASPPKVQSVEVELSVTKTSAMKASILNTTADTMDDNDERSASSYKNYDWEELPAKVQNAATVLGYSKRKWNQSLPTKYDKCEWNELTSEQQDSALILGYNEARWNQWDNGMGDC